MEHMDKVKKEKSKSNTTLRWSWYLVLLVFLLGSTSSYAQISWNDAGLSEEPMTVLLETKLTLDFTPSEAIENASILVQLPTGVTFIDESVVGGENNLVESFNVLFDELTNTLTISFDEGPVSKRIHLEIGVLAECDTENGAIQIQILSDEEEVSAQEIVFTVQTPVVIGTTTVGGGDGLLESNVVGDIETFDLQLSTTNGNISKATVTLAYEEGVILDAAAITFDGLPVSSEYINVDKTETTITLEGDNILEAVAKELIFTAQSNRCGIYTITASVSFACATYTEEIVNLILAYPTVPGTPSMRYLSGETGFMTSEDLENLISTDLVSMDGKTVSYYRVAYENVGSAGGFDIRTRLDTWRNGNGKYHYIAVDDIENPIKYSVDGGMNIYELTEDDYTLSLELTSNARRDIIEAEDGEPKKYTRVDVRIPNTYELSRLEKFMVYYPVAGGAVYDNEEKQTSTIEPSPVSSINWFSYSISSKNACGVAGTAPESTYGVGGYAYPRITGSISATSIASGGHGEATFPFNSGSSNGQRTVDIVVQLPKWLELDGTAEEAISFGNRANAGFGEKEGMENTYFKRYNVSAGGEVTVKYRTVSDLDEYEDIEEGKIRIWVDWNMNEPGYETTLKYFTQVFQDITLLKKRTGIILDDFKLIRDSRGKRDKKNANGTPNANGNGIPDGEGNALPDDVNPSIYLRNDDGRMIFTAHIPESEGDLTYPYMYILLSAPGINMSGANLGLKTGTVTRNGILDGDVSFNKKTNNTYYLEYIPASPLEKDDELIIEIPFKVGNTVLGLMSGITAECYVSENSQAEAFEPEDGERFGESILSHNFGSYSEGFSFTYRGTAAPFQNNNEKEYYFHRITGLTDTPLASPYFSGEVRTTVKFGKYKIEMPAGYLIMSKLEIRNGTRGNSLYLDPDPDYPVTDANGVTTYIYDLGSLFDEEYADNNVISGKWPYPDAQFSMGAYAKVQATKFAQPTSNVRTTVYYDNLLTEEENPPASVDLAVIYSGPRIHLSTNNITSIDAVSPELNISPVTIGNPNTESIHKVWLYIGGDLKNVKLKKTNGTLVSEGEGTDGHWVEVGSVLEAGFNQNYNIQFDYTGEGEDNEIEIYIASGFDDDSWTFDPDLTPADLDQKYVSTPLKVKVKPSTSRIDGSLAIENSYILEHDQKYEVTGIINSESSVGALRKPKMIIQIPAKQMYIAGSAVIEYPKGNGFESVSAEMEAELVDLFVKTTAEELPSSDTYFEFDIAKALERDGFTMPGFSGASDPSELVVTFKMEFSPQCGSKLDGMRYYGKLESNSFSSSDALGSGRTVITRQLLPNVSSPYDFNIFTSFALDNLEGRTAFNENVSSNTLYVNLTKQGTAAFNPNNRLRVEIPSMFEIGEKDDYITISGDLFSGDKTVQILDIQDGQNDNKVYYIGLPSSDYIADSPNNGHNKNVRFAIPLTYTSDESHKDNPVQTFTISIVTSIQFGDCIGTAYAPIGLPSEVKVAVVRTAQEVFQLTIDDMTDPSLEVVSDNFTGKWFKSDKSTELSSDNPVLDIDVATVLGAGDHTLYVSAVFEGVNYGMVPVNVEVYPSLEYTIIQPASTCGSPIDYTTSMFDEIVTDKKDGVTYKLYKTKDGDDLSGEITADHTIEETISYWVEADNGLKKKQEEVFFVINIPVTVTTPADPGNSSLIYNHGSTVKLQVTAKGSGTLTYQWYKDENPLGGEVSSTLEITDADQTKSGSYYVWVNGGECGNVKSTAVTVTVYPDLAINFNQSNLTVCSNDPIGVDLYGNITSHVNNVTYWYSTESDGSNLIELTANNAIPVSSLVTGSYWIYSKHSAATTTTPVEFVLKIEKATRIVTPPNNISIPRGGNLVLSVIAEGEGSLSYQWQKKVGDTFVDITTVENATANDAIFTLSPAQYVNAGNYRVKVKAAGATVCDNEVISSEVNVNVYTPSSEIVYQVTYEASIGGELSVTYQGWPILSGNYVNNGSRLEVSAYVRMAGLYLESLTVNGVEIENGQSITISSDTHIVAVFEVEGSDPNPDPTANTEVVNAVDIWTEKGQLYIRSDRAGRARVIDFSGRIYTERVMIEGETVIPLPDGFYIVQLSDGTTKKIVIKD